MKKALLGVALVGGFMLALNQHAQSQSDPATAKYSAGGVKSDFLYLDAQTRAMQEDDFSNPGFLWIGRGKTLWTTVEGQNGKSCASCHAAAETSMKGVAAKYPKYDAKLGRVVDLEQEIDSMRTVQMGADAYPWESQQLLSLTAFVALQSRGMPVDVATTGPAHAVWLAGQKYYMTRRGQLNMSCAQCHDQYRDRQLRSDTLDGGFTNGFPVYRLAWQELGSVQRRFRECDQQIRAEPLAYGSPDYVALELFVASRGRGLPVETPAVRK